MHSVSQSGYIAVMTAIILSLVILLVASSLGSSSLLSRLSDLNFVYKRASYYAARSCLDHALLQLAKNSGYGGNETVSVNTDQCTISVIETSGSNKIIKARAQVNGATTNLRLTVAASTLITISLEELESF